VTIADGYSRIERVRRNENNDASEAAAANSKNRAAVDHPGTSKPVNAAILTAEITSIDNRTMTYARPRNQFEWRRFERSMNHRWWSNGAR
jgi:hypothetical protein